MKSSRTLVVGADHAGFALKEYIKSELLRMNYLVEDVGTASKESVDYPDYAEKVALKMGKNKRKKGILVCGTGIGASIAANKIPGIRAALVTDSKGARLSREHNDANILVLGGRSFRKQKVKNIIHTWLKTEFNGERHKCRLEKISKLERKYSRVHD